MVIKSYNFEFFDSNVLCRKLLQHVELASSSTLGWRSNILSPGLCGGWFKPCDGGVLVTLTASITGLQRTAVYPLYISYHFHHEPISPKLLWAFHLKQGFSGRN